MDPTKTEMTKVLNKSLPIFINISGLIYETRLETLSRYRDTLLGDGEQRENFFCQQRNEYFFNRHREAFANILFFYQSSGKLSCPKDIDLSVFINECEFFRLPRWAITSMKRKEGAFLEDDILEFILNPKPEPRVTFRTKLWSIFEDPSSSKVAHRFAFVYILLLLSSIVINVMKTMDDFRPKIETVHRHDAWEIADIIINTYFVIEFILRLIISPSKVCFFKNVLVWIDLIALLTFIPTLLKHYANENVVLFFTPFQIFRMIRIFRLAKVLPGFNVTEIILRSSLQDLKLFLTVLFLNTIIGGTVVFYLEQFDKGRDDTTMNSVPLGVYWALQTCVTLGYGDVFPVTPFGKFFAMMFIVGFIPTLSIPVLTIIVKFSKFYEFYNAVSQ